MDRPIPVPGEFYQHFKGMLYQIRCVAEHSETGEPLVIYQALYGDYRIYARPLAQFLSEVDHLKYPAVSTRYRFTQLDPAQLTAASPNQPTATTQGIQSVSQPEGVSITSGRQPQPNVAADSVSSDNAASAKFSTEKTPEELFLLFLDAESSRERLEVLALLKRNLNRRMADSLAASMDLVLPGNSIEEDVELMEDHIRTRAKFETRW